LTTHQLAELEKQREEETKASFERMDQLEEEMEMEADKEKVDEWLREANGISESFRGTRQLFPGNRVRSHSIICCRVRVQLIGSV
jgi:hypothetical protein